MSLNPHAAVARHSPKPEFSPPSSPSAGRFLAAISSSSASAPWASPSHGALSLVPPPPPIIVPSSENAFEFDPEWDDAGHVLAVYGYRHDVSPVASHVIPLLNICTRLQFFQPPRPLDCIDADFLAGQALLSARSFVQVCSLMLRVARVLSCFGASGGGSVSTRQSQSDRLRVDE